jgi:hypothetical protein
VIVHVSRCDDFWIREKYDENLVVKFGHNEFRNYMENYSHRFILMDLDNSIELMSYKQYMIFR